MNVAAVLMEILRSAGVRYLFGNPGTTELPFLGALPDSRLEYVLGLQEATVVAAADGYAQASGQVGVVNVHVAPGLANSLSILHNAARAKSPLVVTAGQQDTRFLMHEPILAGDLARMAEPFTKWSYEIRRAEDAPVALRRALKVALTPPTGPVFLSLPMDLMGPVVEDTGAGPTSIAARSRPDAAALAHAAELLSGADRAGRAAGRAGPRRAGLPAHQLPGHSRALAGRSLPFADRCPEGAGGVRRALDRRRERLHLVPPHRGHAVAPWPSRGADRRRPLGDRPQPPGRARHCRRPEGDSGRVVGRAPGTDDGGRANSGGRARGEDRHGAHRVDGAGAGGRSG